MEEDGTEWKGRRLRVWYENGEMRGEREVGVGKVKRGLTALTLNPLLNPLLISLFNQTCPQRRFKSRSVAYQGAVEFM